MTTPQAPIWNAVNELLATADFPHIVMSNKDHNLTGLWLYIYYKPYNPHSMYLGKTRQDALDNLSCVETIFPEFIIVNDEIIDFGKVSNLPELLGLVK